MRKPLCIDLFCGLGGWTEGFLAEGYDVVGFDIERRPYPAQLVLQDVLTIHGSQFRDAAAIVASPPCTEYSYMAMPWSRAKQIAQALRGNGDFPEGYTGSRTIEQLNALFNACFRIQREASEVAGREIPMVVENVLGAQSWVGVARWHHGSFYLWGSVPALMPFTYGGIKVPSFRFDGNGGSFQTASVRRTNPGNGARFTSRDCGIEGTKRPGRTLSAGFNNWPKDERGAYIMPDGTKVGGDWFSDPNSPSRQSSSRSAARKEASAQIAKIPISLSQHIALTFKPIAQMRNL